MANIGFVVTVVLIVLQSINLINLSWMIILTPLLIGLGIEFLILVGGFIFIYYLTKR